MGDDQRRMERSPIIKACEGCQRIQDGQFCSTYRDPSYWWSGGRRGCPFHPETVKRILAQEGHDTKLNPLKASKRRAKGK